MLTFRWVDWSDTRWLKAGRASRFFLRSVACGLDPVVQSVLCDGTATNYHLNGVLRADFSVRRFFLVAAFAAVPVERIHLEVMRDDRLLRHGAPGVKAVRNQAPCPRTPLRID